MGTRSDFLKIKRSSQNHISSVPLASLKPHTNKKLTWTINSEAFEYPRLVVRELQVTVQELNAVHVQFGAVLCIRVT